MNFRAILVHHGRQLGTVAGLVVLCGVLAVLSPYFLTPTNLLTVLEQTSINAIIAVGMTFVIITAGIDLSVGSVLALSGITAAGLLQAQVPVPLAILLSLMVGTLCGLANGLLVTLGRLPPFIATLGMMSVARGVALLTTDGRPISGFEPSFRALATSQWLLIPLPAVIMLAVYASSHFLLTRTKFGLCAFAIGANEQAAHLSGLSVRFHKTAVYAFSGFTSAVAAVVLTARLNSAQPIAGLAYELDAIAATVIGGTSLMGGQGSIAGTLIGALIMGVLKNGLNLLSVSSFMQQVIIGLVIIAAVMMDALLRRRRS